MLTFAEAERAITARMRENWDDPYLRMILDYPRAAWVDAVTIRGVYLIGLGFLINPNRVDPPHGGLWQITGGTSFIPTYRLTGNFLDAMINQTYALSR